MRTRILLASLLPLALAAGCAKESQVSYQKDVVPILKKHCYECHTNNGQGMEKSGLNMASYQSLMKGTKYGRVIVPGKSVDSTLVRLIEGKADPSINMPHNRAQLPEDDQKTIIKWIDQGAKDN